MKTYHSGRRRFLSNVVKSIAFTELASTGMYNTISAMSKSETCSNKTQSPFTVFREIKQISAGVLNVGFAEVGSPRSPSVILLHGWPYDIYSFEESARLLSAKGYRVIIPYLRGFGSTTFLSQDTVRNGQQSAFAKDIIDLMEALQIQKAIIAGFDWGARIACIIAALWPERCKALISVSGYLIGNRELGKKPLSPKAELQWWYQFYFATERGKLGYQQYTKEFANLIWKLASPTWQFDEATFMRSAIAFENPDHVDIVIHNYRWRMGIAEGEARYEVMEKKLAEAPLIHVPAITMEGDDNGAPHPEPTSYAHKFTDKYKHIQLKGIGHNLPQEAPTDFANAIHIADQY